MGDVAFIFHGLRSPENLGSIARVMNNFGLSHLVLAEPLTYAFGDAEKLAVKSVGLLDAMRIETSLEQALAPYAFVVGTTSREVRERTSLDGRAAAARLHDEHARGEVAVLFGSEKLGLNDAQLDLCQAVCRLPTSRPQPSLNVSQAAAILAYELSMGPPSSVTLGRAATPPRAPRELMELLFEKMTSVLLAADFLNPQNPQDILDELRRLIDRAAPTPREASLLLTAFRKVEAKLQRLPGGT